MSARANFDAASGERMHPAAREALLVALDQGWADPARLHTEARRARLLLDTARESIAAALGARPDEVSFTASGTQACHLAVLGAAAQRSGARVLASAVEHSAVLNAGAQVARRLEGSCATVPVDTQGLVDVRAYDAALAVGADHGPTAVACLQLANHEVGTVQPVAEVAESAARCSVPLFVDAAAAVGRIPVPDAWSMLTASAHKWGGPAGVGVLAVRTGVRWRSPLPEDEREGGRVPGFVDVPAVVAAAAALEAVTREAASPALHRMVDRIRTEVPRLVPDVVVVGPDQDRLPHLVTFSLLYLDGESVVGALDRHGFAVGSGSACTASSLRPSHVLAAMGVLTHGNVRVSLGRGSTDADVGRFLAVLPSVVADLRAEAGVDRL